MKSKSVSVVSLLFALSLAAGVGAPAPAQGPGRAPEAAALVVDQDGTRYSFEQFSISLAAAGPPEPYTRVTLVLGEGRDPVVQEYQGIFHWPTAGRNAVYAVRAVLHSAVGNTPEPPQLTLVAVRKSLDGSLPPDLPGVPLQTLDGFKVVAGDKDTIYIAHDASPPGGGPSAPADSAAQILTFDGSTFAVTGGR